MGFIDKYPYTDFHELNLDWILGKMRQLGIEMDQFKALNTITFSGVWDITKQYPAWTVVDDNNLGYISIRPVPAGIVITNTDYWVTIVDYTAELAGIHSDITNLQNDVAALQQAVGTGKYLFMGDSYQATGEWYQKVLSNLGMTDQVNAFYAGDSGHGFTVPGGEWENDYTAFCTGRTDLDEFTDVIIVGGLNDSSGTPLASDGAAIRAAIDSFVLAVKSRMTKATVSIAYVGSAWEDSPVLYDRGSKNRVRCIEIYSDEIVKQGGRMLIGTENAMCSWSFFISDYLHPSTLGGEKIAKAVSMAITNGCAKVLEESYDDTTVNFVTGDLMAFTGVHALVDNGVSRATLGTVVALPVVTPFTISATPVDLGQIPALVYMRNSKPITIEAQRSNVSTAEKILVTLQIVNSHLMIQSAEFTTSSSFKTVSVAVNERFDLGTITFEEDTLLTM